MKFVLGIRVVVYIRYILVTERIVLNDSPAGWHTFSLKDQMVFWTLWVIWAIAVAQFCCCSHRYKSVWLCFDKIVFIDPQNLSYL